MPPSVEVVISYFRADDNTDDSHTELGLACGGSPVSFSHDDSDIDRSIAPENATAEQPVSSSGLSAFQHVSPGLPANAGRLTENGKSDLGMIRIDTFGAPPDAYKSQETEVSENAGTRFPILGCEKEPFAGRVAAPKPSQETVRVHGLGRGRLE